MSENISDNLSNENINYELAKETIDFDLFLYAKDIFTCSHPPRHN